ncbi:glutamate receptor [Anabrus simplex]|uniref:glutamate receptor n=1 Tax=Anabrus simplex TaxID=316456 RepID=UPI0035A379C0
MPLMVTLFESEALKHYFQQLWEDQTSVFNIWLTFLHVEGWEEFLAAVNVPFCVQLLIAQPTSGGSIHLTEVYRVAPGFPLTPSFCGEWERCGQNIWPSAELYQRRSDLQGLKMNVAAVNGSITLVSESMDGNKEVISFAGSVLDEIKQMVNVKTTTKVPKDYSFGTVDSNGSWNGVVSMLINNEADISATALDMSSKRADVVDFLFPLTFSRYCMFIKKKSWYVPRWNSLLKPFNVCLWLTVLVAVIANATGLTIISKLGHRFYDEKYFSPSDSLLYVLAALAQQCCSFPRFFSARVVCLCSHLMALVILASYSASLVSFLTVQKEKLPFQDLKSMVEVGTYRPLLVHSSFEHELIAVNSTGVYRDVFIHLMGSSVNDSPTNYLDALKRVCSSNNIGLMSSDISVGRIISKLDCVVTAISLDINHTALTFPVRKNSPYRGLLNICFQMIRERGIYQRLWLNYDRSLKISEEDVELRFIELTDILPLLAIFGFGCTLALLLLALEVLSARMLRKHS